MNELAEIEGEISAGGVYIRENQEPIKQVSLPIVYYIIVLTQDVPVKIFLIH